MELFAILGGALLLGLVLGLFLVEVLAEWRRQRFLDGGRAGSDGISASDGDAAPVGAGIAAVPRGQVHNRHADDNLDIPRRGTTLYVAVCGIEAGRTVLFHQHCAPDDVPREWCPQCGGGWGIGVDPNTCSFCGSRLIAPPAQVSIFNPGAAVCVRCGGRLNPWP